MRHQSELADLVEKEGAALGAFLIEPETYARLEENWLPLYRKTLYGMHTILVGLSTDPAAIYPLRSQCHLFVDRAELPRGTGLLLDRLKTRALTAWEREYIGHKFKAALRAGDLRAAEKWVGILLRLDPTHSEILCFSADLSLKLERPEQAILLYRLALESNPCFPHPYIKLLEALPAGGERAALAEMARRYCPDHPVILKKATQILKETESQPADHPGKQQVGLPK